MYVYLVHFEDISHSTVYLLSNLFNCHGLIKSKFNRLDSLSKVRFDWRISMGQIFFGGGAKCPWFDFNRYKYSVRNIKSINIIVVYILPSCQASHI